MKHLAFLFSCILTAAHNKSLFTIVPNTILTRKACFLLEDLGYISGFSVISKFKLKVNLRYFQNKSTIRTLSLLSKQSSRVYLKKLNLQGKRINSYIRNNSFVILTTSSSFFFLTDVESFFLSTGGEALFVVN